jgi:hypothetical protein
VKFQIQAFDVPTFTPSTEQIADYPYEDKMADIEKRLMVRKAKIDPYYKNDQYERVINILEYYKNLKFVIKEKYDIKYGTNAWLKMYELLHYLPLVANNNTQLYAFHNCELPGAFIQATLYYMCKFRPTRKYIWNASSLVLPKEKNDRNALDDQYHLYANNRSNWIMSMTDPTNNGDTTKVVNIHHMVSALPNKSNIYTSDAGIGVGFGMHAQLAFNDQEQLNMIINIGQLLAMLETLDINGNFVTKQYTFFKPYTYSLMIIVASMFETFYITKPLTSRASNSEIYLVGIGFRGLTAQWKQYLETAISSYKGVVPMPGPLLPADVIIKFKDALDLMIETAKEVYEMQGELIESNIELFNDFKDKQSELTSAVVNNRQSCEDDWISRYQLRK